MLSSQSRTVRLALRSRVKWRSKLLSSLPRLVSRGHQATAEAARAGVLISNDAEGWQGSGMRGSEQGGAAVDGDS